MSVPSSFNSKKEYLLKALEFLKIYQWLYNYHNTHILVHDVFEKMPSQWLIYFQKCSKTELQEIALGIFSKKDCEKSPLKGFLEDLQKLKPDLELFNTYDFNDQKLISHNSGLSKKKLHEILHFAPFVHQICKHTGCNIIIDIGSGLGYLSHILHDHYNYRVLGIECSQNYIKQAYKLQGKNYPQSKNFVKFVNHFIDENSSSTIESLLEENFDDVENKNVCITGLHACADLSITILDIFSKIDSMSSLVVMPCCYHRIKVEYESENAETFKYFPASNLCKIIFENFETSTFLRRPFLRLACQQTVDSFVRMTNEDLDSQSRNCMYRAILQDVAVKENQQVQRLKRKSGKSHTRPLNSTDAADFEHYLHNLVHTHQLIPTNYCRDVKLPTKSSINNSAENKNLQIVFNSTTVVETSQQYQDTVITLPTIPKASHEVFENRETKVNLATTSPTVIIQELENAVDMANALKINEEHNLVTLPANENNFSVKRGIQKNLATLQSTEIPQERENTFDTATALRTLKINDGAFLRKMHEKWEKHNGDRCLFKALTALQFSIQSLCENVVLLDRVAFLSEKGLECYVKKVAEGVLSPRCYALVAVKK